MSDQIKPCPICLYNSKVSGLFPDYDNITKITVNCLRCGTYKIQGDAIEYLPQYISADNRLHVSSLISDISNDEYQITYNDLDRLTEKIKIPSVDDRADRVLLLISDYFPRINEVISWQDIGTVLNKGKNFDKSDLNNRIFKFTMQLMSKSWCEETGELVFLIYEYLKDTEKYLKEKGRNELAITPAGWTRINKIKTVIQESNIAFIALKFDDKLIEYSKNWFEPAITEAGYDCKIMYSHKHTKVIDNEMKALIRRSKFLVCDLTENSRGAYYEAGFAHGLGIPVIFLC